MARSTAVLDPVGGSVVIGSREGEYRISRSIRAFGGAMLSFGIAVGADHGFLDGAVGEEMPGFLAVIAGDLG